nr:ankyrin repeat domain-containing protein [Candidatus Freyarchaeota archaeon]
MAKKTPKMKKLNKEIRPYESTDGEYESLLSFSLEAAQFLDNNFITSLESISEIKESEPYYYERVIRKYGSKKKGFEVKWQVDEVERGSVTHKADTVVIKAYGLPRRQSLMITSVRPPNEPSYNRTLTIEVEGFENAPERIIDLFVSIFSSSSLSDKQIKGLIDSGISNINYGRWGQALKDGLLVLKHQPDNPEAFFIVGVANGVFNNLALAKEYLRKAVEKMPEHYDAWYNLGNAYLESKEYDEATKCFKSALEVDSDNHAVFYQLGKALKESGRVEEAIEAFQYSVYTSPNPDNAFHYTGMDFTEEAKEALEELGMPWTGKEKLKPIEKKTRTTNDTAKTLKPVKESKQKSAKPSKATLNNKLLEATRNKDLGAIKEAIQQGAEVNATDENRRTALVQVCDYEGNAEIARFLIENGADVNYKAKYIETPLNYASMYGHVEIVKLLLDAGADVNKKGDYGRTPIMYAVKRVPEDKRFFEISKLLLDTGADVNLTNEEGDNVLLELLWEKQVDYNTVKLLIDHGIDLEYRTQYYGGLTAIIRAANMGHFEIVKLLLNFGKF